MILGNIINKCYPEVSFSLTYEGTNGRAYSFLSCLAEILPECSVRESSLRLVNVRMTENNWREHDQPIQSGKRDRI